MTVLGFWTFLILACYSYLGYPVLLATLRRLRRRRPWSDTRATEGLPRVTLIITAHNEEARVRDKLENALAIDYPPDRLQCIVASDCSTDATEDLVREYASRGVLLVCSKERLGKENAQRCALGVATGDIVVFSDVATRIPSDALRSMAGYFDDPGVGAVSSEDRFLGADGVASGEGAYVRYEMWLRRMESDLAGLVGLSGSFFAARREVCREWDIHSPSDFNTAFNCARLGVRAVTAPDVLGYYADLKDPGHEYRRKVRTVLRGMTAVARHPDVLGCRRFGMFAFQVWSHKVMRWLVPWFLLLLFLDNLLLAAGHRLYTLCLLGQLALYGTAVAAWIVEKARNHPLVRLIYFFVQVNVAIAEASCRFVSGQRMTTWKPSAR